MSQVPNRQFRRQVSAPEMVENKAHSMRQSNGQLLGVLKVGTKATRPRGCKEIVHKEDL